MTSYKLCYSILVKVGATLSVLCCFVLLLVVNYVRLHDSWKGYQWDEKLHILKAGDRNIDQATMCNDDLNITVSG